MSNLPNPNDFKTFKVELEKSVKFDEDKSYNLEDIFKSLVALPKGEITKIIDIEILKSNPNTKTILDKFVKWSNYHNSMAIVLEDKTVTIHRAKDGKKWKTYGSKKHIQHLIKDDDNVIFVVYGMAEILLCEIFEVSYVAFQSDSITKSLDSNTQWLNEIVPKIKDKYLVLLLDNDDSCRNTINPISEYSQNVIPLEMMDLHEMEIAFLYGGTLRKELPKGYDFRDYCNHVKSTEKIENILNETIKGKI